MACLHIQYHDFAGPELTHRQIYAVKKILKVPLPSKTGIPVPVCTAWHVEHVVDFSACGTHCHDLQE